jgi:hypothetical protein
LSDLDNVRLVSVELDNFNATLPWTVAMPGGIYLALALEQDVQQQFAIALSSFIDLLSEDKREEFKLLDIQSMSELLTQWFEKSTQAMLDDN